MANALGLFPGDMLTSESLSLIFVSAKESSDYMSSSVSIPSGCSHLLFGFGSGTMTGTADDGTPYNASTSFIVTESDPWEHVILIVINRIVALSYEVIFQSKSLKSRFSKTTSMPDGDFEYSTFIFGLFY